MDAKDFDCVDRNKLWKIQEMGTPDHLTYLLRNLYAGPKATTRTTHELQIVYKLGKEYIIMLYIVTLII